MNEAKKITIDIDLLPITSRIERRGDELERQIPIRGRNYRGVHKYEIWTEKGRYLQYSYTMISLVVDAPMIEEDNQK